MKTFKQFICEAPFYHKDFFKSPMKAIKWYLKMKMFLTFYYKPPTLFEKLCQKYGFLISCTSSAYWTFYVKLCNKGPLDGP